MDTHIASLLGQKLLMCSLLSHPAFREVVDLVRMLNWRQTMSNRNGCSTLGCLIKCLLNDLFWLTVECRGSFVKEQDFRISNEGTSDSDTLLLTTRKLRAFPTDFSVKTIWQGYDKVVLKQKLILFLENGCWTHDIGILAGCINLILSHLLYGLVRTQKNIKPDCTSIKGLRKNSATSLLVSLLLTGSWETREIWLR